MSLRSPMQLTLFEVPGASRPVPERSRSPRPPAAPSPTERSVPARAEALPRAAGLAHQLSEHLGLPVHLTLTDNRATLVSFRRRPEGVRVRVHHLFLDAPEAVVRAMAAFVGRDEARARAVLEAYAGEQRSRVRRTRKPGAPLKARGQCFDLRALYEHLNATYFEGHIQADIGWARRPGNKRRKTIRLGVYDARLREIRVHPALDQPHVPAFVVEAVIFHAMLHQLFPEAPDGSHPSHSPEFLERERAFPLLDSARRWQREHLRTLLRG
ncbi:hypothetical protein [Hyalangium rubrum]|uniref:Uncharacterized protein n=1 Tax=Hyalangium rubrum TaxID=3103134 RepID=A0ABU5H9C4_9BACT|nr:hypothetical protein [Hyalangium sp. s54d21]MDY7230078.1 hypothetical protein [Hyalangium sp. s54d21]